MRTDPVLLEIIKNKFQSVTEEMGRALMRTGHTIFVNETADFGNALGTLDGELFAYPRGLGINAFVNLDLKDGIRYFDNYQEGDIVITNDPYTSGCLASHLTDINLFKPVFWKGEIVCFAWSYIHATDVGGKVAGSLAPSSYEIYQEGLRIPPTKLYKAGELNREFLEIFKANCRIPEDNWGDLKAIIAALNTGERRVHGMLEKYGEQTVKDAMADVLDYAEKRAEAIIARIPDGTYEFSDYMDDDVVSNLPFKICLKMTVKGSHAHLDFTGTDPQLNSAFNLPTMGKPHPWVTYRLLNYITMMDPTIPVNGGIMRPVSVYLPEGSVVNCVFPAAIGLRTTTGVRVNDVIIGALSRALPKEIPAACSGAVCPLVLSEPNFETGGRHVVAVEPIVGGVGGAPGVDGVDARDVGMGNMRNNPIEIVEADCGVLINRYEIFQDSGGPGEFRGGTGVIVEFQVLRPDSLITARGLERFRFRAWGVQGGRAGAKGEAILNPGTPQEQKIGKIDVMHLKPGDVVRLVWPGAGGWGNPLKRDPLKVVEDVHNGFVSKKAAEEDYGVVIRDGAIDHAATRAKRELLAQRLSPTDFDFGPEREEYERVWSPELHSCLIDILNQLPIQLRPYVRQRLIVAIDDLAHGNPVGNEVLLAEWEKLKKSLATVG